jgi:hypothetical protein
MEAHPLATSASAATWSNKRGYEARTIPAVCTPINLEAQYIMR